MHDEGLFEYLRPQEEDQEEKSNDDGREDPSPVPIPRATVHTFTVSLGVVRATRAVDVALLKQARNSVLDRRHRGIDMLVRRSAACAVLLKVQRE